MGKREKEYERIPGKGKKFIGKHTLWMGKDHLLYVEFTGFSETYKRFYFKDIRAIATHDTSRRKTWSIVWGSLTIVALLLSIPAVSGYWIIPLWIVSWPAPLLLLINWLRGPTCRCVLSTAVTRQELPSLHRLRTARKALNMVIPKIEEAQRDIVAEAFKPGPRIAILPESGQEDPARTMGGAFFHPTVKREAAREPSKVYVILFALLIVYGLLSTIDLFFSHAILSVPGIILLGGSLVSGIIAVARQLEENVKEAVRSLTWIALACISLDFIIGYFTFMHLVMKHPKLAHNHWALLMLVADASPFDSGFSLGYHIFSVLFSLVLGSTGLLLGKASLRKAPGPAPAGPPPVPALPPPIPKSVTGNQPDPGLETEEQGPRDPFSRENG
ncbi:MAG: hypothetical protein V1736_07455 [Pseudomonadota bacterium]